ncbi:MAG: ASCH domain-containing protein [Ruminococcaceae bacterium]|nr:ASCH domain-containing protein [Oscillospiraceae bacterium]
MRKNKKSPKNSTLKNDLLNGLGELLVGFIIIALALVLAVLLPTQSNDFEFYLLIAGIIFALSVGLGVFIHLLVRELKKSKDMRSPKADTDEDTELVYPAHQMKLRPEPFTAIQSGQKTLELRLYDEKRQKIKIGDTIVFTQTETGEQLHVEVIGLRRYPDYEAMYAVEDPIAMGYNEGETADPKDMSQYYTEDEIKRYGTVAIEIRKIDI